MKLICVSTGSKKGNSYILQASDGKCIALDCGATYKAIEAASGYRPYDIEFALATHGHEDHSYAIPQIIHHGIDVFSNADVVDKFPGVKCLGKNKTANLCGWKVTPFEVPHTNGDGSECQNYAYIIERDGERLLYMTDWMYCRYKLSKFRINHFLIAVNYTDLEEEDSEGKIAHVVSGHASLDTVKDFLKASMTDDCRSVVACHLSERNADKSVILRELNEIAQGTVNVAIAERGHTYEL